VSTKQLLPTRTCRGTTKAGKPCRSTAVGEDGFCSLHAASPRFSPAELGRLGGVKSGEVRRELSTSARERLRRIADEDAEFWALVKAAYRDGLQAVTSDGEPDYRTRVQAASAFLSEAYGRPPQAVTAEVSGPEGKAVRLEHVRRLTLADVVDVANRLAAAGDGPHGGPRELVSGASDVLPEQ